jgi:Rad3-related DNA helicase
MSFPSLSDIYVKKRKALTGGDDWYSAETAKTFLQAIGRTTRGPDDMSTTFVLDSRFKGVYGSWKRQGLVPKYVQDSVRV